MKRVKRRNWRQAKSRSGVVVAVHEFVVMWWTVPAPGNEVP